MYRDIAAVAARMRRGLRKTLQPLSHGGVYERWEPAVENVVRVANLQVRPLVAHESIRIQHVRTNLVTEGNLALVSVHPRQSGVAFGLLKLVQFGLEHLPGDDAAIDDVPATLEAAGKNLSPGVNGLTPYYLNDESTDAFLADGRVFDSAGGGTLCQIPELATLSLPTPGGLGILLHRRSK